MPPAQDVFIAAHVRRSQAMTRQPLTPPAESLQVASHERTRSEQNVTQHPATPSTDDNTAVGMALSQEESMYLTPASSPTISRQEEKEVATGVPPPDGMDEVDEVDEEDEDTSKHVCQPRQTDGQPQLSNVNRVHASTTTSRVVAATMPDVNTITQQNEPVGLDGPIEVYNTPQSFVSSPNGESQSLFDHDTDLPSGLAKVDISLNRKPSVQRWDFTDKKPIMKTPSSLFQPYSKYIGTQQSDRQTYNVEVTILTVDMAQSTMSGYLLIRGLTPEHPMLQTFFTGEIVGGPNQRYSFKTKDPAWGASDKVDLQHWLRFPPWRQLTSYAKRDMNFDFPLNDEPWWSQEHIYMRWKEHFLVPDYKQSNIQGASFEGFYYICLNQIEGKISGVYFHSKSEKYQQLELTHVTKKGLGIFGTSPLVVLR